MKTLRKNSLTYLFIHITIALFSAISIFLYLNKSFYNILFLILYVVLLKWYLTSKLVEDKKIKKYSFILSLVFSTFLALGNLVANNLSPLNIGFLTFKSILKTLIIFLGFFPIIYKMLEYVFLNIDKIKLFTSEKKKMSGKLFIAYFMVILALWSVLFFRFFPSIMTGDSYYVVHNVLNNILSDHHTFGHTWFFGLFFIIGKGIFSTINGGVAFYIIFQMIIMDLIFLFTLRYFYNRGLKKWLSTLIVIFIGLNPLFARYSVTLWRDILFSLAFLVLFLCLYDYIINNYKVSKLNVILFTIFTFIMLFFRNNGIYVFMVMTIFIVFIGKDYRIRKMLYCLLIIVLYFGIKGPVFNYFNVEKGKSSEAYSIPIQQISRVIYADGSVSEEEFTFLSKVYDTQIVKEKYDPVVSDKMKETINNSYLQENKVKFFKTWFSLLVKNPSLYFEAYFTQTLGYWYPDIQYWATGDIGQSFLEPEFKTNPLLPDKINKVIDKTTDRNLPFAVLLWSIGLNFFLLILSTALSIYKYGFNHFLYHSPFYCVWLTMMLATPVFAELRYVFAIFACMPFLLIIPFRNSIKK